MIIGCKTDFIELLTGMRKLKAKRQVQKETATKNYNI